MFLFIFSILLCFKFATIDKKPKVLVNNFSREVVEGELINCRKIKDLGVILYLNDGMKKYDNFKIEFHRYGEDGDILVGYKTFIPNSKEFTKKYANTDSVKLKLLTEENQWNTSDFEVNTIEFTSNLYVNNIYCAIHEKKHVNFYLITRGYTKTGEKNKFGESIYSGKDISQKSVVFQNWDFSH